MPRRASPTVPARRRRRVTSPAVPIGGTLLVVGVVWLALAALPPLLAILLGAILLSVAVAVGVFAVAMAPIGLMLFGLGWLIQRMIRRSAHPPPWACGYRPRR